MAEPRQSRAVTANGDAAGIILPGGAMGSWSISCWVRGLAENKRFVVVGVTDEAAPIVELKRAAGVIAASVVNDAEDETAIASEVDLAGGWNHVALVADGLGAVLLYVQGELEAESAPSGTFATGSFVMAGDDQGDAPDFDLAHLAIWERALSDDEVSSLFTAGRKHDMREDIGDYTGGEDGPQHWWPGDGLFKGMVLDRGLIGTSPMDLIGLAKTRREA